MIDRMLIKATAGFHLGQILDEVEELDKQDGVLLLEVLIDELTDMLNIRATLND